MSEQDRWPELTGIGDGLPPPPGREIVREALRRSALTGGRAPAVPRVVRAWELLVMEARVQPVSIWLVSALVMAAGIALTLARPYTAGPVLALLAPLVAGAGIAAAYGPRDDGVAELVAVTPTSPRVILLARMTLVFGYDLLLGLAASVLPSLSPFGPVPAGPFALVMVWLGPTAVMSALSLLLSVCWRAEAAAGGSLVAWGLYAFAFTGSLTGSFTGWSSWWPRATGPGTIGLALALTLAAVAVAGLGEPFRRPRATNRS
ncbi:hypothetical protein [Streptosporangium saharense]|uniref:hypothetical protein n=1 Tax=Streptosporangium saharense TaxID=1706840 RepID=UPI0036CAB5B3